MSEYISLMRSALEQKVGLAVLCTSREAADKLRQTIYVVRAKARESGDLSFDCLSLSISPHSSDILFVYKKPGEAEVTEVTPNE